MKNPTLILVLAVVSFSVSSSGSSATSLLEWKRDELLERFPPTPRFIDQIPRNSTLVKRQTTSTCPPSTKDCVIGRKCCPTGSECCIGDGCCRSGTHCCIGGCCPDGTKCGLPGKCDIPCAIGDPPCGTGCCKKGQTCVQDKFCEGRASNSGSGSGSGSRGSGSGGSGSGSIGSNNGSRGSRGSMASSTFVSVSTLIVIAIPFLLRYVI